MDQWRSRLWSLQPDPASPRPRESSLTSPLSPTLPSEVRYGGPVASGRAGSVGPSFVVVVNVESGVTSDGFPPCHRAGTHGAGWLWLAHSFSLSSPPLLLWLLRCVVIILFSVTTNKRARCLPPSNSFLLLFLSSSVRPSSLGLVCTCLRCAAAAAMVLYCSTTT